MSVNGRLQKRTSPVRSGGSLVSGESGRAFIEDNLKHLQKNSHKKRRAQEIYYSNANGCSPMIRYNKRPVHERLSRGPKNRFIPLGTNTSSLLPKNRSRQNYNKKRFRGGNHGTISKTYSAQNRINRIRQQQAIARELMAQNQGLNNRNRPFKLRRTLPGAFRNDNPSQMNITDLTVTVANHQPCRRFKLQLNHELQMVFKAIQAQSGVTERLQLDRTQEIHATKITLDHRFSNLS